MILLSQLLLLGLVDHCTELLIYLVVLIVSPSSKFAVVGGHQVSATCAREGSSGMIAVVSVLQTPHFVLDDHMLVFRLIRIHLARP